MKGPWLDRRTFEDLVKNELIAVLLFFGLKSEAYWIQGSREVASGVVILEAFQVGVAGVLTDRYNARTCLDAPQCHGRAAPHPARLLGLIKLKPPLQADHLTGLIDSIFLGASRLPIHCSGTMRLWATQDSPKTFLGEHSLAASPLKLPGRYRAPAVELEMIFRCSLNCLTLQQKTWKADGERLNSVSRRQDQSITRSTQDIYSIGYRYPTQVPDAPFSVPAPRLVNFKNLEVSNPCALIIPMV